jgi:hypothetical protein
MRVFPGYHKEEGIQVESTRLPEMREWREIKADRG